ncbi:MAG: methionyl-tRNA formyltransferase, partial [Methylocystis sp.]
MRVVFMGTPDFAAHLLKEIVSRGHEIAAVYTPPPRPAGRGMAEKKSAVHLLAESLGHTVRSPKSLKNAEAQAEFAALDADVAVVAAYGLLLP